MSYLDNLEVMPNFEVRYFEELVMSGEWIKVINRYNDDGFYHKLKVMKRGTALHVAISNGEKNVVKDLVTAILNFQKWNDDDDETHPLRIQNERGCTPLHVAAYRGFISMCESIIGENGTRKNLIKEKNEVGETPLFWAVLGQQKTTFVYLHHFFPGVEGLDLLKDKHGNTILHVAIRREMFDLASIIMYYYGWSISSTKNEKGVTPLQELATRSSAFQNGNQLSWCEKILYHCFLLKPQDPETELKSLQMHVKKGSCLSEAHCYSICCTSIRPRHITELDTAQSGDKSTHLKDVNELEKQDKVRSTFDIMSEWPILSLLGLKKIKIVKTKRLYAAQLLKKFIENFNESYWGGGGGYVPPDNIDRDQEIDDIWKMAAARYRSDLFGDGAEIEDNKGTPEKEEIGTSKIMEEHNETKLLAEKIVTKDKIYLIAAKRDTVEIMQELISKLPIASDKKGKLLETLNDIEKTLSAVNDIDPNETTYLVAAKHGIVEITTKIEARIKSVIHDRNSNDENVLLLAVKYRQPQIVQELQKSLLRDTKDKYVFKSLCQQVDKNENTMLHLAAYTSLNKETTWRIAGPAMQMMWDVKWYKYIKGIVPEPFKHRINKDNKTPGEIFKEEHGDLLEKSTNWLKDTAESCSVVAALIAGLSFATSGSVPGGNKESGKPALEGQPAFEGFAVSSLIGLYFSGLALIMFLSILTSRKQIEDFGINLPAKLLGGLTSLFVSIVAMFISFCAGHFFVLTDKYGKHDILFYLIIFFSFPVIFYGAMQLPLYIDLIKVIFKKVPPPSIKGVNL